MIEGFIGRPGSGKTYSMTARALGQAKRGQPIFSNYPIDHPSVTVFAPDELLDLPPGLVIIDEAHLWFPARQSLQLPPSWLAGLSQTRKAGWDLWWSAQHESRVDRVLRDVTNWMWLCQAYLAQLNPRVDGPLMFTAKCWEPELFRKPEKHMGRRVFFYRPKVAAAYDTLGTIEVATHAQSKKDAYARPRKAGPSSLSLLPSSSDSPLGMEPTMPPPESSSPAVSWFRS